MNNEQVSRAPEDKAELSNGKPLRDLVEAKLGAEALNQIERSGDVIRETLLEALLVLAENGEDVGDFQKTTYEFSEALFLRFTAENLDKRVGIISLKGATALMSPGAGAFPELSKSAHEMVTALISRYGKAEKS